MVKRTTKGRKNSSRMYPCSFIAPSNVVIAAEERRASRRRGSRCPGGRALRPAPAHLQLLPVIWFMSQAALTHIQVSRRTSGPSKLVTARAFQHVFVSHHHHHEIAPRGAAGCKCRCTSAPLELEQVRRCTVVPSAQRLCRTGRRACRPSLHLAGGGIVQGHLSIGLEACLSQAPEVQAEQDIALAIQSVQQAVHPITGFSPAGRRASRHQHRCCKDRALEQAQLHPSQVHASWSTRMRFHSRTRRPPRWAAAAGAPSVSHGKWYRRAIPAQCRLNSGR